MIHAKSTGSEKEGKVGKTSLSKESWAADTEGGLPYRRLESIIEGDSVSCPELAQPYFFDVSLCGGPGSSKLLSNDDLLHGPSTCPRV
jgi:hypothetical protein